MKLNDLNKIANVQNTEAKAKIAAEKAAREARLLENIKPGTLLDMLEDIREKRVNIITDENDNIIGFGYHPHVTGITTIKKIGNHFTVGCCETERLVDEFDLKAFYKKYGDNVQRYFYAALKLNEANLIPDEVVDNGKTLRYIILKDKKVIDDNGNTILDLSNEIPGEISKDLLMYIIKGKLDLLK